MLSRHDISDDHWDRIRHLLPGQAGGHGGVGNDTRLFLGAACDTCAKTGVASADLADLSSGKPSSHQQRYNQSVQAGRLEPGSPPNSATTTPNGSASTVPASAPNVAAAQREKKPTAPAVRRPRRWGRPRRSSAPEIHGAVNPAGPSSGAQASRGRGRR